MHDHLQAAVGLAESIRYSGDHGRELAREGSLESSQIHYQFNETGLRLSADMISPWFILKMRKTCKIYNPMDA